MFLTAMMLLATAQAGATAPAAAAVPAAEKKVCRRTNATNSRLAITKACHTRSEWARRIDRGLSLDTSRSETAGERVVQVGQ